MKNFTLLMLLFVAITVKVNAQETVLCTFEESPRLTCIGSAGSSIFTMTNPDKTGPNTSDSCSVFVRVRTGNWYAASLVTLASPVEVPAGEMQFLHIFVYSNALSRSVAQVGGVSLTPMTNVDTANNDIIIATDKWLDYVFKIDNKAGTEAIIIDKINFRADRDKILTPWVEPANAWLPANTELDAATGYVCIDEIVLNTDSLARGGDVTAIRPVSSPKLSNIYSSNGKIFITSPASKAVLYNVAGQRLSSKVFKNNCEFEVRKAGIYIVQLDGKASKVLVR